MQASQGNQELWPGGTSLPAELRRLAKAKSLREGRQLHAVAFKRRQSADIYVQTSLISLYAACGLPDDALKVFEKMPRRTPTTHTAAAVALLRSARPSAAAALLSDLPPDPFSLSALLSAAGRLSDLPLGCAAHALAVKTAAPISTALIDMYGKCGEPDIAVGLFTSTSPEARPVECWNALLQALAVNGRGEEAVRVFARLEAARVRPNKVTFLAVLAACAHAGLVLDGRRLFESMWAQGVEPGVKHYGAMVALLGRAGRLNEAAAMALTVPGEPVVWAALLGACRDRKDLALAEQVAARVVGAGPTDESHWVILSSMYREAGEGARAVALRRAVGRKPRAASWLQVGPMVHEFAARA